MFDKLKAVGRELKDVGRELKDAAILPIVEHIIEEAVVTFDKVEIMNLKHNGFDLNLEATLTKTGIFPATIKFNGLNVIWSRCEIATLQLEKGTKVVPLEGGKLKTPGTLTITDSARFTEFLGELLTKESFDWIVKSPNLGVSSVKIPFDNVPFSKPITLKAFAGLKDISLQTFELLPPYAKDDPSIKIKACATVVSSSQLSIFVGKVRFHFFLGNSTIGEFSAEELKFPANGKTKFEFLGQIVEPDLSAVGILISKFLKGEQQTLTILAKSLDPPVAWLSSALNANPLYVRLNGEIHKVIQDIEFSGVSITGDRRASSTRTIVTYINPFGFSFQIVEIDVALAIGYQDVDKAAELNIKGMTATIERESINGSLGMVRVGFKNEILSVLAPSKFGVWCDDAKHSLDTPLKLRGTATVLVKTPVGLVKITDLPFYFPSCKFKDLKWL